MDQVHPDLARVAGCGASEHIIGYLGMNEEALDAVRDLFGRCNEPRLEVERRKRSLKRLKKVLGKGLKERRDLSYLRRLEDDWWREERSLEQQDHLYPRLIREAYRKSPKYLSRRQTAQSRAAEILRLNKIVESMHEQPFLSAAARAGLCKARRTDRAIDGRLTSIRSISRSG